LPGEAEAGQEGAGLGQAAANPGEFGDPLDGFGGGADGAFGQRLPDDRGMGGEIARGAAGDDAALETVESAVAVGEDVPLRGGDADVGEAGRVLSGMPEVDGPEDVHLAADDGVGMPVAVGEDGGLEVGGKRRAKPGRHLRLRNRAGETSAHFVDLSKAETGSREKINPCRVGYSWSG